LLFHKYFVCWNSKNKYSSAVCMSWPYGYFHCPLSIINRPLSSSTQKYDIFTLIVIFAMSEVMP